MFDVRKPSFDEVRESIRFQNTNTRGLTEEEFLRGKERLRRAVQLAEHAARTEARTSWLDLLVLTTDRLVTSAATAVIVPAPSPPGVTGNYCGR